MQVTTHRKPKRAKDHVNEHADQFKLFEDLDNNKTAFTHIWETEEILKLQRAMLVLALEEIRDRRKSLTMRREAWNWLFSDADLPFGAQLCAKNAQLDIDRLRYLVRKLVTDIPLSDH
jgi:hypothetical protein